MIVSKVNVSVYKVANLLCYEFVQDCIAQMVEHADLDITFHFTDSGSSPTIVRIFFKLLFPIYPIYSVSYIII